jgi:PTH2 family peptidyl-tRNA hydrolase
MVKQVIVIRKDLNMRKGKMCSQSAHASLAVLTKRIYCKGTYKEAPNPVGAGQDYTIKLDGCMEDWLFFGPFTKIVVGCNSELELLSFELLAKQNGIPHALIQDAGVTEFNGVPTYTALAIGPALSEKIDEITGHLKLL